MGRSITPAANGEDAVEASRVEAFDLILMDIRRPIMGGFQAFRAIREELRARNRYVPVIALTAYASDEDGDRCLEPGFDDHASNPLRVSEIEDLIERLRGNGDLSGSGYRGIDVVHNQSLVATKPESMVAPEIRTYVRPREHNGPDQPSETCCPTGFSEWVDTGRTYVWKVGATGNHTRSPCDSLHKQGNSLRQTEASRASTRAAPPGSAGPKSGVPLIDI